MERRSVDLGSDLGEGGPDFDLLPSLTWGHLACGGHAGDEPTLRRLLRAMAHLRIRVGAHPSYPDPLGFGRRELGWSVRELVGAVSKQLSWLRDLTGEEGLPICSVKPHGALYHRLNRDREAAAAFLEVVQHTLGTVPIVSLPGSVLLELASRAAFPTRSEGFADRSYDIEGNLRPRQHEQALILDPQQAASQALALLRGQHLSSGFLPRQPITILCVHSDTPNAPAIAQAVRHALNAAGLLSGSS